MNESRLRPARAIGYGLLAEVLTVVIIVIVLQVHARFIAAGDAGRIADFARRAPAVLGPGVGVIMTFIAAWLAARPLPDRRRAHGVYVGVVTALLTVPGLFAGVPEYRPIYIAAMLGKLIAGYAAGALSERRA
jgi:hypothetical protein